MEELCKGVIIIGVENKSLKLENQQLQKNHDKLVEWLEYCKIQVGEYENMNIIYTGVLNKIKELEREGKE